MKQQIAFFLLATTLLGGCAPTTAATSASTSADTASTAIATSTPTSSAEPASESIETTSVTEIVKDISVGGYIIDINVGAYLAVGNTYEFTFSFSEASNENPVVQVSDTSAATISNDGTDTWSIKVLKAKDIVFVIKDNTGFTHYRNVLHLRNPYDQAGMEKFLVETDHFQSWKMSLTDLQMIFLGDGKAVLSGKDEGTDIGSIDFTYEYASKTDYEYTYTISDFKNKASSLAANAFHISVTGDLMHLMMGSGDSLITAAVFNPVFK